MRLKYERYSLNFIELQNICDKNFKKCENVKK